MTAKEDEMGCIKGKIAELEEAEARKQTAQEIIEEVIGDWNCDCGYGGLVIADAIKAKFGLEVNND